MNFENELDKIIKQKTLDKKKIDALRNKAYEYIKKTYNAFGYFYYDGFIGEIKRSCFNYDYEYRFKFLGNSENLYIKDIIKTKQDLVKFKKELNKTFDVKLDMSKEDLIEIMKNYAIKQNGKDKIIYKLSYNQYNEIRMYIEQDDRIWFGYTSGYSSGYGSSSFDCSEGVSKSIQIDINNIIRKIEVDKI